MPAVQTAEWGNLSHLGAYKSYLALRAIRGPSAGGVMGKEKGRPKRGRLADMAEAPEEERYHPPPLNACEEFTIPIRLPQGGGELRVRFATYQNLVVDFAVVQIVRIDGKWEVVAKIDCDRGVIHRHQYARDTGEDLWDHRPLYVVPTEQSWQVVDRWYEKAVDMMEDEWEDNLRRWNGDSA